MVSPSNETRGSIELRNVTATEVPGTFRVNGSSRRTRELQTIFERPPDVGPLILVATSILLIFFLSVRQETRLGFRDIYYT